jgi:hypothetical protein
VAKLLTQIRLGGYTTVVGRYISEVFVLMKRMLIVPFALLLLAVSAAASPVCTTATLSQYVATPCTIGNLLFSDFSLTVNTGSGILTSQVTVTPQTASPLDPGIRFSSMPISVSAGGTMDVTISYVVATLSGSALIEDYSLSGITGSAATNGWGTVTASFDNTVQQLLAGVGAFPGTPLSEIDLSTFANVVHVSTTIHVTKPSGTPPGGLASISIAQENFSEQIPEPFSAVLIGSGLVLLGLRRIRVKPGA